MEVFIFLSRPDTSISRVDFSTDGSSRPDRIVTIRRDICSFPGSSTSGSKGYFLFKLHGPTFSESGRQQQLTTRLSSCILDMCRSKKRDCETREIRLKFCETQSFWRTIRHPYLWWIDNRTSCRPILSVIILNCRTSTNQTPASRSSDFLNHSYDNRPNWTPLSPITITNTPIFWPC